jgi:hypothetical protein
MAFLPTASVSHGADGGREVEWADHEHLSEPTQ